MFVCAHKFLGGNIPFSNPMPLCDEDMVSCLWFLGWLETTLLVDIAVRFPKGFQVSSYKREETGKLCFGSERVKRLSRSDSHRIQQGRYYVSEFYFLVLQVSRVKV